MSLDRQKIQEIIDTIAQGVTPSRIFLFGSHARGAAHSMSDLDLLVIANMPMPQRERRLLIRSLFARPDFSMDLFVLTEEEFKRQRKIPNTIARTVDREGVVVYE
ncbi:MAG TPA: nucleotidyltransferase domain-containing protein [Chloroflexi bacterium]|nr:nucleotidyltransferase domain-containing protein [Chloroflexota bacterium]